MKAADISKSKRLMDVANYWSDGNWHSTMETIHACNRAAINSIASELRQNGYQVDCEVRIDAHGRRSWWYRIPPRRSNADEQIVSPDLSAPGRL